MAPMAMKSDSGVVLRRLEYSETSQIVVLFTRKHGKVRAIAKGIHRGSKKRFAAGIDLLEIGNVTFSVRGHRQEALATLTEWKQTRPASGLRAQLMRLYAAMYLAEITAGLTEDWDPHEDVFEALVEGITALADSDDPLSSVVRFQDSLLRGIGSIPLFDACVHCSATDDLAYFSSHDGGLICSHCAQRRPEQRRVSPETGRALQNGVLPAKPTGVFRLFDYHIAHLMGREPRLGRKLLPPSPKADRNS